MDVAEFLSLLDVEPDGDDGWIGRSPANGWKRVFGGQVLAQALVAAERSVENRTPHSLHAYFIVGGDPAEPIEYRVERVRDGRSFSVRRVVARQKREVIFVMAVSFQAEETGALDHAFPMPAAPAPEITMDPAVLASRLPEAKAARAREMLQRVSPIEMRPIDFAPPNPGVRGELKRSLWIRIKGPLPADPLIHRAALVYLSDMTLIETVLVAHGHSISLGKFQTASLDHAVWLHRPFRADEWLLYSQETPSAQGSRGITRGLLFTREGTLAASAAQEGLVRLRSAKTAPSV